MLKYESFRTVEGVSNEAFAVQHSEVRFRLMNVERVE